MSENTEIKKMRQGMSYSCKEKTIILNVFKYFRMEHPEKGVTELVRKTAEATGCSEKSVFQFRKEEASAEGFKTPSKTKIRKNININSRDLKYDESVRTAIRSIYYDLKCRNVTPSLNVILKAIHEDAQLPHFSLMTLRRLLFDMGFAYLKEGNKSILIEKPQQNTAKSKNVTKSKEINVTKCRVINNVKKCRGINHVPSQPPPIQNNDAPSLNHVAKPTPHHPLNVNNGNGLQGHPLSYQNHPPSFMPIQTQQNNQHMMRPVHPQPPLSHNMPIMLNHWRPPTHQHNMNPPFETDRRNDYLI